MILAVRLDRIARSMVNFHDMLKSLDRARVRFHCVDQPEISTDSSTGTLVMGILGYVAQFERDLIRDRTKAGLYRARAQGKVLGRPKVAATPGQIVECRGRGLTLSRIAEELHISKSTVRRLKKEGEEMTRKTSKIPESSQTDDFGQEEGKG